ncbi:PEP-CTERM sorting domain-containing protein [Chitinimonas arctica]|uniref:PEP-CTERM sorting domain-containing protein n=1 Tax=Chitinimonas arctica TaxID=2594795 RepID=UPI001CC5E21C|nr:PEP-CTERM sorting domain-containing protein [Chitinimonas arctica]
MKKSPLFALSALAAGLMMSVAQAAPSIDQFASGLAGFSSQWSSGSWSASQVLGASNTFSYGDISTAWAPSPRNGSLEWVSVTFDQAVFATGATIRETYGNGFVYQVDAIGLDGSLHNVWSGTDTSQAGTPVDFAITWAQTAFAVKGLKIYTNTDHDLNAWEEIDSIKITGAVPEPETYAMLLAGLGLIGFTARRRRGK